MNKSNFGGKIRGGWRGALSVEKVPENVDTFKVDKKPFYLRKRFIGSCVLVVGWIVKFNNPIIGEAILYLGSSITGVGLAHAAYKSKPDYNGKAGWFYRLVNLIFTKEKKDV